MHPIRRIPTLAFAALIILGLGACTNSHTPSDPDADPDPSGEVPAEGATASALIGPGGGELVLDALRLEVPAGALEGETEISVEVVGGVPSAFRGFTPVFRFEPDGLEFAEPVQAVLPFDGDGEVATIFWSRADGEGFVALDTEVSDGLARADIRHFSQAFVGTGCEGGSCCRRASSKLDVLLQVDNSNSMAEEQASLAEQIPRMAQVLATGDLDGDGTQDFPAVESLQLGVISPDMGTGGFSVPTCNEPSFGDDGILKTSGRTDLPACAATYDPIHSYRDGDDASAFASDMACVARLGTGGCGFEQQLEATLKAVTPSSTSTLFYGDTTGHGDGENAGLIRDDSVLAVINITDEDDCSSADPELYNPSSTTYPGDLNLRCVMNADSLHPVGRYVDGLLALRDHPSEIVYAAIAGVPQDLAAEPGSVDYDAIMSDPRMAIAVDPANPTQTIPSCNVPGRGLAFPPRRLVETARDLDAAGASGIVHSICQQDFTPAMDAILTEVAARLSGSCG